MVTTLFVALVFIPLLYRVLAGPDDDHEPTGDGEIIDPRLGTVLREEPQIARQAWTEFPEPAPKPWREHTPPESSS